VDPSPAEQLKDSEGTEWTDVHGKATGIGSSYGPTKIQPLKPKLGSAASGRLPHRNDARQAKLNVWLAKRLSARVKMLRLNDRNRTQQPRWQIDRNHKIRAEAGTSGRRFNQAPGLTRAKPGVMAASRRRRRCWPTVFFFNTTVLLEQIPEAQGRISVGS
jgi:hypothetical protein